MTSCWYALRSKPRKEDALYLHALGRGFDLFYPRIPVQTVNPRARKIAAYFPGYMFVRANLGEVGRSTFQWMPHALGLVCFDDTPAPVPHALIERIEQRVVEIAAAGGELFYGLKPGDPVTVKAGPFAGYEAIFNARLSGGNRVRVLLTMLNDRQLPLDLSESQILRAR